MVVELHGKSDSYVTLFLFLARNLQATMDAIFSPQGYFLLVFAHLWLFGVGILGLGSWIGFFEVGFLVDVVWACGVRPSGLFRVWALYINMEEKPWEKSLRDG